MKQSYPDVILNAFKSVQAWKSLSLLLMGVLAMETAVLLWMAGQRTVLLVPQMAQLKEPVKLNIGAPFTPAYLTEIARGDAFTLLSWTPDNIEQQYSAILARMSPSLHAAQKESLLQEAKAHRSDGLTQSFHPTRQQVSGAQVTLSGILIRAVAGREVFRGPATYIFTYENGGGGYLQLAGVSQPTSEKAGQ